MDHQELERRPSAKPSLKSSLLDYVTSNFCFLCRFRYGRLVEVNTHSLFSKYFSESGKLVGELFSRIHSWADEEDCFIVVLIDEVESLTCSRVKSLGTSEPSDAMRAVNSMLTELDMIKRRKNVIIMATSNITEAVDPAFLDRADVVQYIGNPSHSARYSIVASAITELMRARLVENFSFLSVSVLSVIADIEPIDLFDLSLKLFFVLKNTTLLSGRFLRKLVFLVYAKYYAHMEEGEIIMADDFIDKIGMFLIEQSMEQ